MTGLRFTNQTIVVVTAATKRVHGTDQDDWKAPAETFTVDGCTVQPAVGSESQDDRTATLVQWQVLAFDLAKASLITERNHIRFGGLEYQIVGAPLPMIFGMRTDHIQILMNVWKG